VTNALGSLCEGEDLRDLVVAESRRRPTGAVASRTLDERAHPAAVGLLVELEQHVANDLAQFVGGHCAECRVDVVETGVGAEWCLLLIVRSPTQPSRRRQAPRVCVRAVRAQGSSLYRGSSR